MAGWEPKVNKSRSERIKKPDTNHVGEWVIEKNIPIPPPQNGKRRTGLTAAIRSMEVGDSVLVTCGSTYVSSRISGFHATSDMRFVTRSADGGMRVWRVE